jgi:hypothetical protein
MIYHIYTITCKQNEKMYISQSLNPTRQFKQHALNPPTKMITNVYRYKPFEECFELKNIFSSYKKYLCDHKKRKLILTLQTTQNKQGYNTLKSHLTSNTRYWRLYRRKLLWYIFF